MRNFWHAVTAHQVQELLGQARAQGQGVEVFHQPEELTDAPRMQAQQRFVQLDMLLEYFAQVGTGHTQNGGDPVGIGIVRASVAVEDGDIAKPDARFYVGQGDLLARKRGGTDPHSPASARNPLLGNIASGGNQVAVFVAFHVGASEYVVSQGRG